MTDTSTERSFPEDIVIADTVRWLEKAVIGLNLCPFAKSVHVKGQIHYVVSQATDVEGVVMDLHRELEALAEISPDKRDTTLLILPQALQEFLDFNDFLEVADAMVEELELGGILQVASFHPRFQFEGTDVDDVTNCTNRAPYPTLHLLREDSIDKAVEAFPEAETIYERNMEVLEQMGIEGWLDLDLAARCPFTGRDATPPTEKD
ncbi:DUF1415 domain-containing protein [Comamonas aquatica]|uniref:DUF1415 domain-containing protein n=1 Tax=Comamonas aquatica TaxID=225991 RepID=UPI00244B29DD|nr:DUF1415 domain-containing protein [Comamonas aquatica]MDH1674268.1 DUF1415 domain-containing protein [Comamonas aquatica]MDH1678068.1 DUF1415 domain-containing protein [Comamonas aquatica]